MSNRISEKRALAGLSQAGLAQAADWHQSRLSNYERGTRVPDIDDARLIVIAFRKHGVAVTLDELFPVEEEAAGAA